MMDEKREKQIDPISQPPYYGKEQKNYEFCKFCSHVLMRKTQKTLTRCPNCGEPYYEN